MTTMIEKLEQAAEFLRPRGLSRAKVGVVLGTGLGALADEGKVSARVSFSDIPHLPQPSVTSHAGQFHQSVIIEKQTAVNPNTLPTAKSIPPATITSVMPHARMPNTEAWRNASRCVPAL